MKLLYILKSFANTAGTERVISDKINYLAHLGYQVTLVTYEQGNHPCAFPLHPAVQTIDLNTRFFLLGTTPIFMRPLQWLKMRRKFRSRLQNVLNDVSPDVIISTTYSFVLLDIILSMRTDACHVVESHVACFSIRKSFDYRHIPILGIVAKLYDQYIFSRFKKCRIMVALTEGDASDWRKYVKHVKVVPNPVTEYPDHVLQHDITRKRIICVGRLQEQKGFDMLIEAFSLIANQCPDWQVDIYGSGNEKQRLENMIRQYHLVNQIHIHAPIDSIYEEYQKSDFLVLSSRYEGFGLVLLEAMACGIPCIAFRCKYGPEDIVTHQGDGLLVHNGDINDMADNILWMINHTLERQEMGCAARQKAMKYCIDIVMSKWISLFNQLLSE